MQTKLQRSLIKLLYPKPNRGENINEIKSTTTVVMPDQQITFDQWSDEVNGHWLKRFNPYSLNRQYKY